MALRLNPSANYLTLASAPAAPYTVVVNVKYLIQEFLPTVVFGDAALFGLYSDTPNKFYLSDNPGEDYVGTTAISLDQWYKIAWTWDGSTDNLYIGDNLEISTTGLNTATRNSSALGRLSSFTPNVEGIAMDGLKIWSALLSENEISQEIQTIKPVRKADLWAWLPNNTNGTQGREYGGNNRHFTVNGTPVDVSAAPVPWGEGVDIFPASSAPPVTASASPLMLLACQF